MHRLVQSAFWPLTMEARINSNNNIQRYPRLIEIDIDVVAYKLISETRFQPVCRYSMGSRRGSRRRLVVVVGWGVEVVVVETGSVVVVVDWVVVDDVVDDVEVDEEVEEEEVVDEVVVAVVSAKLT